MAYTIPEEFRTGPAPDKLPLDALKIEWTGVAGFKFEYKGSTLLIDPHVTRPGLLLVAFAKLKVNNELALKTFPGADHILLGHSHYDHLMDVPCIAAERHAVVHGSGSTTAVCRGAGLDTKQIHEVEPGKPFSCGELRVTFIKSLHGRAFLGRSPFPGEITGAPGQPMKGSQYKAGMVFGLLVEAGGFRIYHCGSADLIEDEMRKAAPCDLLLPGLAGRKKTPDYLKRMVDILQPKFIIPQHYDNFFKPLKKGLTLLYSINIEGFLDETRNVCPDARVIMPEMFSPVAFDTVAKRLVT